MSNYCPECGDVLSNPTRCDCGWKENSKKGKESGPNYPSMCMRIDCENDTAIVIWKNAAPVTRCCACYASDIRSAGKQQLRIYEEPYKRKESPMQGKLGQVLKEVINAKRVSNPEPKDYRDSYKDEERAAIQDD